jgi:hypothetical protein
MSEIDYEIECQKKKLKSIELFIKNSQKIQKIYNKENFNALLKEYSYIKTKLRNVSNRLLILNKIRNNFKIRSRKKKPHMYNNRLFGCLKSDLKPLEINSVKFSRLKKIDLSLLTSNLTSLCILDNGNILVLDSYMNSINELDSKFRFLREIRLNEDLSGVRESRMTFNSNFYGILATKNFVHINNMECNEIIILDKSLDRMERIFSPIADENRSSIFLCEVYKNFVYVLSYAKKIVLKFDEKGVKLSEPVHLESLDFSTFDQEFQEKLEKSKHLVNVCNSFTLNDTCLSCAVPLLSEIHLYNLSNGKLCNRIQSNYDHFSLCTAENYLINFSRIKGSFYVYKFKTNDETAREEINNFQNFNLEFVFKTIRKYSKSLKQKFSYSFSHKSILYCKNCLYILFSEENFIISIDC